MRNKPLPFKLYKQIYSKVPRLGVEIIIKTKEGLLLTLRNKHGYLGQWHLPGGTVHYREAIKDAVKRIAQEELGVEVNVGKLVGYIEYFSEEKERGFGYAVTMAFICEPTSTNYVPGEGAEKLGFFKTLPINTIAEQKEFLNRLV